MVEIVNVNNLPQIGRPNSSPIPPAPTSIRFSEVVTATPVSFVFPQGAGTNFKFGIPQYIFIDNSSNDFEMIVSVQGTSYSFPAPALSTGMYNIDVIDGDTITVTSAGVSNDKVEIVFYNFNKAPIVWYKNQSTSTAVTIADGADAAEGSVADAPVTNPALNGTVIGLLKGLVSLLSSGIVIATSKVQGLMPNGTVVATAGNPLVVAGQDGANSRSLLTDGSGRLTVIGNGTFITQSAVTVADGADVTQGAKADAAITNPATAGSVVAFLKGILTQLQAAIPAGAAIIGKVGIDQTTPGTTNGVQVNAALPAGANLLGKVGIDQTMPGTTNGVQVNAALPAGTNTIGSVGIVDVGTTVLGDSGNVANASAVATLAGTAAKTTYITGFCLSASGATAGADVTATITGLLGGTKSYTFTFPLGAAVPAQPINVQFSRPLPASAQNTAIVVTLPAGGTGNTNAAATAEGYQL